MEYQTIKGEKVPSLGLGTYRLTGEACVRAVERALSMGYRHVDTAQMYGNEAEVGRGIGDSGVDQGVRSSSPPRSGRATSPTTASYSKTSESLKKLRTEYVDLLLMHWPGDGVPLGETLGAMRELQDDGSVLHVGVSNFSPPLVEEATEHAEIFCNQVQYHPYRSQDALLDQAQEMDYLLTAYTPLSRGGVQDDAPQADRRGTRQDGDAGGPALASCSRIKSRPSPRRRARSTSGRTSTSSISSSPERRWTASSPWAAEAACVRPRAWDKGRGSAVGAPRCDHRRRGREGRALDHRTRRRRARRRRGACEDRRYGRLSAQGACARRARLRRLPHRSTATAR